ncbi:MAG: DnaA/Hda family protein [Alphaproteobacteria bacterium]|nr:DnaA/Hda family protein [Alphaproteobacteria bacterium]
MPKHSVHPRLFEPKEPPYTQRPFIIGAFNQHAHEWLSTWPSPELNQLATFLFGPKGSGKKHISHLWAHRHNAQILYCHKIDLSSVYAAPPFVLMQLDSPVPSELEEYLFHLFNHLKGKNGALLITAPLPLEDLHIQLPDLKSRIATAYQIELEQPDDETLAALYKTLFFQKGLHVNDEVVNFLVWRLQRNFITLHDTVTMLENASCAYGKPITIPFVKGVLGDTTEQETLHSSESPIFTD